MRLPPQVPSPGREGPGLCAVGPLKAPPACLTCDNHGDKRIVPLNGPQSRAQESELVQVLPGRQAAAFTLSEAVAWGDGSAADPCRQHPPEKEPKSPVPTPQGLAPESALGPQDWEGSISPGPSFCWVWSQKASPAQGHFRLDAPCVFGGGGG